MQAMAEAYQRKKRTGTLQAVTGTPPADSYQFAFYQLQGDAT
jgi:hypothetical protein